MVAIALAAGGIVAWRVHERNKETMWNLYADVHNLATWQAAYFNDNASFAADLSGRYYPEHGATVRITSASDTSWTAIATHPNTRKICSIAYSEPRGATANQVSEARGAAMAGYACK